MKSVIWEALYEKQQSFEPFADLEIIVEIIGVNCSNLLSEQELKKFRMHDNYHAYKNVL